MAPLPLIGILRGVTPATVERIVGALFEAGFRVAEIPLNSPEPLKSIEIASRSFDGEMLIGAGTVLSVGEVQPVCDAGGQLIVSPNSDHDIIRQSKALGLGSIPGIATPSEAFAALNAGADMLKVFPAEGLPPVVVKAWRAVLPKDVWLLPVGGITPATMGPYLDVGANGFGLGSALFRPDSTPEDVAVNARSFAAAFEG